MKTVFLFLSTIFITSEAIGAYLLTHGERSAGGLLMAGGFFVVLMTEWQVSSKKDP
jgi:hypothetical protein